MCYGVIYTVENKVNGKIYVGQTTKSFNERYRGDILNTHNEHLRNSIKKYGIENFVIDKCLCECDSEEELNEAEKFYIDFFDSANSEHGYNKTFGGEGGVPTEETKKKISESLKGKHCGEKHPNFGKPLSEEHRQKLSESLKGKHCGENSYWYGKPLSEEHRQKISESKKGEKNPNFGKPLSEEHRQKISESLKGKHCGEKHHMWGKRCSEETKQKISESLKGEKNPNFGKPLSEEHRQKLSESKKGEKNPLARAVIQLDKKGKFIKKWNCISKAAKELNINNIGRCCSGKYKHAGGFKWMYEEDYKKLNI